jgi:hypothetical protein
MPIIESVEFSIMSGCLIVGPAFPPPCIGPLCPCADWASAISGAATANTNAARDALDKLIFVSFVEFLEFNFVNQCRSRFQANLASWRHEC